jgi:hypothetical protein
LHLLSQIAAVDQGVQHQSQCAPGTQQRANTYQQRAGALKPMPRIGIKTQQKGPTDEHRGEQIQKATIQQRPSEGEEYIMSGQTYGADCRFGI